MSSSDEMMWEEVSNSAPVWMFFQKSTSREGVYRCTICDKHIKQRGSSASNLISHVSKVHSNIWITRNEIQNAQRFQSVTDEEYSTLLKKLMVKYRLPFAILDNEDFQKFAQAERSFVLPSRYTFKQQLKIEMEMKQALLVDFYASQLYLKGTITHDGWSNRCDIHYLSLRFHLIDDDFNYHSHILDLMLLNKGGTAHAHLQYIEEILNKYHLTTISESSANSYISRTRRITSNVFAVVHDNTHTNYCTSELMDLKAIECSAHLLDLTIRMC